MSDLQNRIAGLDRTRLAAWSIGLGIALFVAFNLVIQPGLSGWRLDLTEERLYTLSDGTRDVLGDIDEPITLRLFISEGMREGAPLLADYAARVREMLEQYEELAEGGIRLEIYNPQRYSPEEDLALGAGLQALPLSESSDPVFFGLTGTNSTDDEEVVPFFSPQREQFLEYDLTRIVYTLANPVKPVLGIFSPYPLTGNPQNNFQSWIVVDQLRDSFQIRNLRGPVSRIDDDIKLLMLVQPVNMDPQTAYGVDQFVMRGGRVIAFVDPFDEGGIPPGGNPTMMPPIPDTMKSLLASWGVAFDDENLAADRPSSIRVNAPSGGQTVTTNYIIWMQTQGDMLSRDDIATAEASVVNIQSAGILSPADDATTQFEPLIRTTEDSQAVNALQVKFYPDPFRLLSEFEPSGERLTIAARVTGPVASAFEPGSEPAKSLGDEHEHLSESVNEANILVFADVDMLRDGAWAQMQNLDSRRVAVPFASNGDVVINALDNLAGSEGLISLRGRAVSSRPFTRIQRMQREAEQQYRAEEQALEKKIEDAEQRISQLQRNAAQNSSAASAQTDAEIDQLREEALNTRAALREVQRKLRADINALELTVRALNIWTMPLLVGLFAIGLALVRRRRMARPNEREG